jgi:hypothetical protein
MAGPLSLRAVSTGFVTGSVKVAAEVAAGIVTADNQAKNRMNATDGIL